MPKRKVGPSPAASCSTPRSSSDSANFTPPSGTTAGPLLRAWNAIVERAEVEIKADDSDERTRLMGELAQLLHDSTFPPPLRTEAMALMGRLARRSTAASPCQRGLNIMQGRFSNRHGRLG